MKRYPIASFDAVAAGKWKRPRALIHGTVSKITKEADGDIHVKLTSSSGFVICEIIPELPLKPPAKGQAVDVWGIVRYDGEHKWNEIHPVIGWK